MKNQTKNFEKGLAIFLLLLFLISFAFKYSMLDLSPFGLRGESVEYFVEGDEGLLALDEDKFAQSLKSFLEKRPIYMVAYLPSYGAAYYGKDFGQKTQVEESLLTDPLYTKKDLEEITGMKIDSTFKIDKNVPLEIGLIYPYFQKPFVPNYFLIQGDEDQQKAFVRFCQGKGLGISESQRYSSDLTSKVSQSLNFYKQPWTVSSMLVLLCFFLILAFTGSDLYSKRTMLLILAFLMVSLPNLVFFIKHNSFSYLGQLTASHKLKEEKGFYKAGQLKGLRLGKDKDKDIAIKESSVKYYYKDALLAQDKNGQQYPVDLILQEKAKTSPENTKLLKDAALQSPEKTLSLMASSYSGAPNEKGQVRDFQAENNSNLRKLNPMDHASPLLLVSNFEEAKKIDPEIKAEQMYGVIADPKKADNKKALISLGKEEGLLFFKEKKYQAPILQILGLDISFFLIVFAYCLYFLYNKMAHKGS